MNSTAVQRGLSLLIILLLVSIVATTGMAGFLGKLDAIIRPSLTGAVTTGEQVGYVAMKSKETLLKTQEAVRRYPVEFESGVFRGHYFLRINGRPNTVRSATYLAAIQADINHDLVYAGIQIEP